MGGTFPKPVVLDYIEKLAEYKPSSEPASWFLMVLSQFLLELLP